MRRVYVSTVARGRQHEDASKVYCLDLDTTRVIHSRRLPVAMIDLPNPRGGCRGARGMAFFKGWLWVAAFDGLFRFNPEDMVIDRGYWYRELLDIHQIYGGPDSLQVISTGNDTIARVDVDGVVSELNCLTGRFGFKPIIPGSADSYHANSIDGRYIVLNHHNALGDILTGQVTLLPWASGLHDLWTIGSGEMCTNCSFRRQTIAFRVESPTEYRVIFEASDGPHAMMGMTPLAIHGFTRGMHYDLSSDTLLVGVAPASIVEIADVSGKPRVVATYPIANEIVESVFDVIPHPGDWNTHRED